MTQTTVMPAPGLARTSGRGLSASWMLLALASLDVASGCTGGSPSESARSGRAPGWIDRERLYSSEAGEDWWLTVGGDAGGTHYSRLKDINRENVARLGLAWQFETGTIRGLEATPIVVDGVMYTSGVAGRVYALDAATGKPIWIFEPEVDMQVNRGACCDMVNRGVAVWEGLVYVAALDGVLYALDAATGKVVWKASTFIDDGRARASTGAPQIAGDVVVIGHGGAEYDARGYISAYDLKTGEFRWRFFTVPGDPSRPYEHPELEEAAKTWDPKSRWDMGGGGTVWDAMAYDAELNLLYVGTGNSTPYPRAIRSPGGGDNLYVCSILAIDPRTGRLVWHYQETPGDQWDFTATQPIILTDLEIEGRKRRVLLHAPKNGFLYVLDRATGELLAAPKFAYTNWATHVDLKTGRPVENPEAADYSRGPKIVYPATAGAHNWHKMAWDPELRLLFIPTQEMGNLIFIPPGEPEYRPGRINANAALVFTPQLEFVLPTLPPPMQEQIRALPEYRNKERLRGRSFLQAIDPLTGERRWSVDSAGWWDRAGVLVTAGGLVFQGSATGTFNVYDSSTGELLKTIEVGTSILAAPMTYRVDGVQYVAVMAAWGGGGWSFPQPESAQYRFGNAGRILAFRLDGGPVPQREPLPEPPPIPEPPPQFGDAATIARGEALFSQTCSLCHSNQTRSLAPDLRRMTPAVYEAFDSIVLEGLLLPNGMPRWDDVLTPEDTRAIRAYLIDQQAKAYAAERAALDVPPASAPRQH